MGRWRHRRPGDGAFAGSVLRVVARKVGTFLLAVLVGFAILILVTLPLLWLIWQLMLYAARQ
jgi:hypothetical protein